LGPAAVPAPPLPPASVSSNPSASPAPPLAATLSATPQNLRTGSSTPPAAIPHPPHMPRTASRTPSPESPSTTPPSRSHPPPPPFPPHLSPHPPTLPQPNTPAAPPFRLSPRLRLPLFFLLQPPQIPLRPLIFRFPAHSLHRHALPLLIAGSQHLVPSHYLPH